MVQELVCTRMEHEKSGSDLRRSADGRMQQIVSTLIESLHRAFPHMLNFGSREVFGADVSADDSRSSMPSGSPCNNAHEGAQCR